MLLQALYDYAINRRLLERLPLQRRTVHALIPLDVEGRLLLPHLIPLSTPDAKGKEVAGREFWLPRFPGENNGGRAYFLAEGAVAVFGRDKTDGTPIPAAQPSRTDKNATKAFVHFWDQIQSAYDTTNDFRLAAILAFRQQYLPERDGLVQCELPLLRLRAKEKGTKKGDPEYVASTGNDDASFIAVEKATFGFSVDGQPVTFDDEADPLREYWFSQFARQAFQNESDEPDGDDSKVGEPTLCLVTGRAGEPVARSHKPKILGIPGIAAGGYIVSFAKAAPAFSSYGFEMGRNSPVSESAAAAYALALMDLLTKEDSHRNLGPAAVCFWAKSTPSASGQVNSLLNKAFPEHVARFLRTPFAGVGVDPASLKSDRLYTVALTGNAGRIVVQQWLDQPLAEAIEHFREWWDDLQIVPMFYETAGQSKGKKAEVAEQPPSAFSVPNLARVSLRQSKAQGEDRLIAERIVQLYGAALGGTAPPMMLLKPILDEFHSAFVKDDAKKPTFPFNQSRFALIKLILRRLFRSQPNRKESDFMPAPQLAETPDPAYNLGRLLAVFESLQDKYHNYEKKGAGVIERYYGTASSAPAAVFPLLCRLARHHLSKVRKDDESAANRLDQQIGDILKKIEPCEPGAAPTFKRILSLPEQGVFALGFYQQRAYDRACSTVLSNLGKARELRGKRQPYDEPLSKARQFASEFAYVDLIAKVSDFETQPHP